MSYVIRKLCNYLWIITSWQPLLLIKGGSFSSGMKEKKHSCSHRITSPQHQACQTLSLFTESELQLTLHVWRCGTHRLGRTILGHFIWGTWTSTDFDVSSSPGTSPLQVPRDDCTSSPSLISTWLFALDKRFSNFSEHQSTWRTCSNTDHRDLPPGFLIQSDVAPDIWMLNKFLGGSEEYKRAQSLGAVWIALGLPRNNSNYESSRAKDSPHLAPANQWGQL